MPSKRRRGSRRSRRCAQRGLEHLIVPASAHVALLHAVPAADVEPVLARGSAPRRAGGPSSSGAAALSSRAPCGEPDRRALLRQPERQRASPRLGPEQAGRSRCGLRSCVGQEDDRRLQALGAVHGHDAHLIPARLASSRFTSQLARSSQCRNPAARRMARARRRARGPGTRRSGRRLGAEAAVETLPRRRRRPSSRRRARRACTKSARAQQPEQLGVGAGEPAARGAARERGQRLRRRARRSANSSSSSRPISGLFSTAARVRSSSGSSRKRPSATRSMHRDLLEQHMRSTPATGTPLCFSARTRSSTKRVRRRTRTMMSPAVIGAVRRRQLCRAAARRAISAAMRFGQPRLGRRRPVAAPSAAPRAAGLPPSPGAQRPELDQRRPRRRGCARGAWTVRVDTARARRPVRTPHRPPAAPAAVERNEISSGTSIRQRSTRSPKRCASRWNAAGSAPWKLKIDCLRRRPRRSCAASSRAPSPAKNSSVSAVITCHCSGLVSCASSIRMWSMPPSSL